MLYDRLMEDKVRIHDKNLISIRKDILSHCTVFDISNVAEYFYNGTDQEYWDENDFPNVAPPFEFIFMEYTMPKFITSEKFGKLDVSAEFGNLKIGMVVHSEEVNEHIASEFGVKWLCTAFEFIESQYGFSYPKVSYGWGVNPDGSISTDKAKMVVSILDKQLARQIETDKELLERVRSPGFLHPVFLALSLLHCKNVKTDTKDFSTKLQQSRIKKGRLPLVSYKVLEISPMRRILEHEGNASKVGLKKALHICRGHFKNFSDHGLFGKYKGTYWWEQQLRGHKEQGEVIKTYKENISKGDKV